MSITTGSISSAALLAGELDYKIDSISATASEITFNLDPIKILPDVKDVKVTKDNDGNDRAITVFFVDGTKEKAVCAKNDVFSLENGVSICFFKRLLSTGGQNGSRLYNKLIDKALKVMKRNEAAQRAAVKKAEEEKRIAENKRQKDLKRVAKWKAKKREEQVSILTDAIKRALDNNE